ncbi:hypothetical protein VTL71DRAFT_10081 [Oculimacula yallundae]|uniref:Uncharacterized protein n=1 Tax=Oculimacula yallundae TaxID=86028 RepID=A0ABR4BS40_9HELO
MLSYTSSLRGSSHCLLPKLRTYLRTLPRTRSNIQQSLHGIPNVIEWMHGGQKEQLLNHTLIPSRWNTSTESCTPFSPKKIKHETRTIRMQNNFGDDRHTSTS